ncbi:tyrosine-type recombinase/integrase [Ktedonobacter racemifer]|uniref:tyrosine-type recombinase/integrase n=1 Tax=Ktedonobacter racemifer TaxID=363277 RepID=UPI00146E5B43|nr:site-specific integrase [Ktedonobacter racemifer]
MADCSAPLLLACSSFTSSSLFYHPLPESLPIFQRSDGRWVGAVSLGPGRRKKQFYGKTRPEVQKKVKQALRELEQGVAIEKPDPTLESFMRDWLKHKRDLRVSSRVEYDQLMRVHIIPALGRLTLKKLTPQIVHDFLNEKLEDGLSTKSVNMFHSLLHLVLEEALNLDLVARNVCDRVKPPKVVSKKSVALNEDQLLRLLRAAEGERLEKFLMLVMATGMRRGELLALKWDEIDLENRVLRVRRTFDYVYGHGYVENEPKTEHGIREILLPVFIVEMLLNHQEDQRQAREKCGSRWIEMGYVFTGLKGGRLNPGYTLKMYNELLQKAGLPHIRIHDLRHSYSTLMAAMKVHGRVVQEILGHSDYRLTMNVYTHVDLAMQEEPARLLDEFFEKSKPSDVEDDEKS